MDRPFVVLWREKIRDSKLEAPTKLILLTLSTRMDRTGQNCFPSIKTLASDTSLSDKTVRIHLKKAQGAGWIIIKKRGTGQGWRRNTYVATYPQGEIQATTRSNPQATVSKKKGAVNNDYNVRQEVPINKSITRKRNRTGNAVHIGRTVHSIMTNLE